MLFLLGLAASAICTAASAVSTAAATAGSVLASAGTAISTAATTAGQYITSIASKALKVIPPEPKFPYPKRVDKVIKFIKNAAKKLSDNSNKDIENMPAYDPKDATMAELRNLQIMLNNMKLDLKDKTSVVEELFTSNVKESFDNIEKFIKDDICSYGINIDTDSLRFNFDRFIDNFSDDKKLNCDTLVVVDCPDNIEKLKSLLAKATVKHFIFVGYTRENTYLNGLPTREQFGRLYKFSQTYTNVNIRRDLQKLADYLKLKRELLVFMINVFFEAKFVKIENGLMSGNTNVTPHSLEDTNSYQAYLQKMKVQKSLIYSKSTDLQKWILKYLDENN